MWLKPFKRFGAIPMAWSLESELKKLAKSKEFQELCLEEFKSGNVTITESSISSGGNMSEAKDAANKLKDILYERIRSNEVQPGQNPLVDNNAINISKPKTTTMSDGTPAIELTVSLDGPSVRKQSISPNQSGLENVLALYDTGYSHPIKGKLPYKVVDGKTIRARRNIVGTGFIDKAIEQFNNSTPDYIKAIRDGE